MKRTNVIIIVIITIALLLTSCSSYSKDKLTNTSSQASRETSSQSPKKHIIMDKLDSKAIKKNMIGDLEKKDIIIFLPPTYYDDESKNYPVVYFLHGFGNSPGAIINQEIQLNNGMTAKGAKEFIIVEISGENKYGGSFYANSPITGNWEDFVIDEVIPYVDSTYHTIKSNSGRGISGFSMGGFSSINLALKHPDVFSSVYSLSPGLFDENGLKDAMLTWKDDDQFKTSYGQTFCPIPEMPELMTAYPKFDKTKGDQIVIDNWNTGFGNLKEKVQAYLKLSTPLKAITIQYGEYDSYNWIPMGCKYFSRLLKDNNIQHNIIVIDGEGHNIPSDFVEKNFIPFFNQNLIY